MNNKFSLIKLANIQGKTPAEVDVLNKLKTHANIPSNPNIQKKFEFKKTNTPNYKNNPQLLYVHHSQVPQSVVASNPAEWYHPTSEETEKLYSSKKIPTFTPNTGWTDQLYIDNRKNYEKLIDNLRAQYNKSLMSAKDLRYYPVPAGSGPLDPISLSGVRPGYKHSPSEIIDAQGNRVNDFTSYINGSNNSNANRVKYNNTWGDESGDAFSYNFETGEKIHGFKHSTVSDLQDWSYNPYKAAMHPDYATRQGNVASWDRVKGMPTVRNVLPVRDGDKYIPVTRTLPDYSASLEKFTHADNRNATRLPNPSGKVTIADLEASGLLSKPQTIQYESYRLGENDDGSWGYARRQSSEENARTARLQDLFTDRLLVPGKVDRSVQVSELLSDAIGDARRDAILDTATSNNWNHKQSLYDSLRSALQTQTYGRAHLAGADNLSLPITFIDDVNKEGVNMNYTVDGIYNTYLDNLSLLSDVDPRYKMYRNDGIIRVFTGSNSSSWSPGSSKIKLNDLDHHQRNGDLLDKMRASSETDKFNIGTTIGEDYHHNDLPANGLYNGDIRNALLHEGIHASTGFNSNVIESQKLRNARMLHDIMTAKRKNGTYNAETDYDVWTRSIEDLNRLHYSPANYATALGAALDVSRKDPNKTSRGYASNSEPEMLRALHHAKSGFARHLISENKLRPRDVVKEVQNPDKFLDFMQGIYNGSIKGNNADPTSYSFPSSMSQVGTEREMARSVAGIQPLIQTLLLARRHERARSSKKSPVYDVNGGNQAPSPKDNHIFRNWDGDPDNIKWKDNLYTPAKKLEIFRNNIWPLVRNNNNTGNYQTLV